MFLTGSDTSANALFGNLQVVTAQRAGLNPVLTASVNSAAGVMGKMISVQSIAVAVAATGMTSADEGRLFRFTIKHSIFLMAVMGIMSMLFAYVFPSYVRQLEKWGRVDFPAKHWQISILPRNNPRPLRGSARRLARHLPAYIKRGPRRRKPAAAERSTSAVRRRNPSAWFASATNS